MQPYCSLVERPRGSYLTSLGLFSPHLEFTVLPVLQAQPSPFHLVSGICGVSQGTPHPVLVSSVLTAAATVFGVSIQVGTWPPACLPPDLSKAVSSTWEGAMGHAGQNDQDARAHPCALRAQAIVLCLLPALSPAPALSHPTSIPCH